jgi:probable rRNA maturation factor
LNVLSTEIDVIPDATLPPGALPGQLEALIEFVLRQENATGEWALTVLLTTDSVLRKLHLTFMGLDSETDVMTFPFGDQPGHPKYGGEIAISVERATAQAPDYAFSAWDEIRFLAIHGTLHLLGWEDELEERRVDMLERQHRLLSAFDQRESE